MDCGDFFSNFSCLHGKDHCQKSLQGIGTFVWTWHGQKIFEKNFDYRKFNSWNFSFDNWNIFYNSFGTSFYKLSGKNFENSNGDKTFYKFFQASFGTYDFCHNLYFNNFNKFKFN